MYALELNGKFYCTPSIGQNTKFPYGWQFLERAIAIDIYKDHEDAVVSADLLRSLGGSYKNVQVVELSQEEEEFLICLKLKNIL